jgi:hypothetical protein
VIPAPDAWQVIHVGCGLDDLQEVIDSAPAGATIYAECGAAWGSIVVDEPLTLIGGSFERSDVGSNRSPYITLAGPWPPPRARHPAPDLAPQSRSSTRQKSSFGTARLHDEERRCPSQHVEALRPCSYPRAARACPLPTACP